MFAKHVDQCISNAAEKSIKGLFCITYGGFPFQPANRDFRCLSTAQLPGAARQRIAVVNYYVR